MSAEKLKALSRVLEVSEHMLRRLAEKCHEGKLDQDVGRDVLHNVSDVLALARRETTKLANDPPLTINIKARP